MKKDVIPFVWSPSDFDTALKMPLKILGYQPLETTIDIEGSKGQREVEEHINHCKKSGVRILRVEIPNSDKWIDIDLWRKFKLNWLDDDWFVIEYV